MATDKPTTGPTQFDFSHVTYGGQFTGPVETVDANHRPAVPKPASPPLHGANYVGMTGSLAPDLQFPNNRAADNTMIVRPVSDQHQTECKIEPPKHRHGPNRRALHKQVHQSDDLNTIAERFGGGSSLTSDQLDKGVAALRQERKAEATAHTPHHQKTKHIASTKLHSVRPDC